MTRMINRLFGGWLRRRERAKHLRQAAWVAIGGNPGNLERYFRNRNYRYARRLNG